MAIHPARSGPKGAPLLLLGEEPCVLAPGWWCLLNCQPWWLVPGSVPLGQGAWNRVRTQEPGACLQGGQVEPWGIQKVGCWAGWDGSRRLMDHGTV